MSQQQTELGVPPIYGDRRSASAGASGRCCCSAGCLAPINGVCASHLDYDLDEYTLRFNRRTSHSRGLLFRCVLEYAVQVPPVREGDSHAIRVKRKHYQ